MTATEVIFARAAADVQLRERVRRHLPDFTWPFLLARSRLELASTGAAAGLLGAAAWAARHACCTVTADAN